MAVSLSSKQVVYAALAGNLLVAFTKAGAAAIEQAKRKPMPARSPWEKA